MSLAGESFTWGGRGALGAPANLGWGGGAERGSKGHQLISSIQIPEILPPTISGAEECMITGHNPPPLRSPKMPERFGGTL